MKERMNLHQFEPEYTAEQLAELDEIAPVIDGERVFDMNHPLVVRILKLLDANFTTRAAIATQNGKQAIKIYDKSAEKYRADLEKLISDDDFLESVLPSEENDGEPTLKEKQAIAQKALPGLEEGNSFFGYRFNPLRTLDNKQFEVQLEQTDPLHNTAYLTADNEQEYRALQFFWWVKPYYFYNVAQWEGKECVSEEKFTITDEKLSELLSYLERTVPYTTLVSNSPKDVCTYIYICCEYLGTEKVQKLAEKYFTVPVEGEVDTFSNGEA